MQSKHKVIDFIIRKNNELEELKKSLNLTDHEYLSMDMEIRTNALWTVVEEEVYINEDRDVYDLESGDGNTIIYDLHGVELNDGDYFICTCGNMWGDKITLLLLCGNEVADFGEADE